MMRIQYPTIIKLIVYFFLYKYKKTPFPFDVAFSINGIDDKLIHL